MTKTIVPPTWPDTVRQALAALQETHATAHFANKKDYKQGCNEYNELRAKLQTHLALSLAYYPYLK